MLLAQQSAALQSGWPSSGPWAFSTMSEQVVSGPLAVFHCHAFSSLPSKSGKERGSQQH